MLKSYVATAPKGRVLLVDSITKVAADDHGAHVVSASHGGASSGEFALETSLASVFFNDAGVGRDRAGVAGLDLLQAQGIAACTVSHDSARIGESASTFECGVISHANAAAAAMGAAAGLRLRDWLATLDG